MESNRKTLQELTFKDNFMFAAVMLDPENAKGVLERALDMKVDHVEVSHEKTIVYNPEYKGIRLDVYIKDENNTRFNVEMQVANKKIKKRARYYHSQIDIEILETGTDYENIPSSYVIFICDFDPIGLGKYKYTRLQTLLEDNQYEYDDGTHTVFLSTTGNNDDDVSEELIHFLKFVGNNRSDSQLSDFSDPFVQKLQQSINKIKLDREMGRRYMLLEEIKKEEYKAGLNTGLLQGRRDNLLILLSTIAPVPQDLEDRLISVESIETLDMLTRKMLTICSLAEFEQELDSLNL